MNHYTRKFEMSMEKTLKDFFINEGAVISDQLNAVWRARTPKYSAILYNTGKFLIQGSDVDGIAKTLETTLGLESSDFDTQKQDINVPLRRIGVDESGKGDFFGPLVIAGVMVDENNIELLKKAGIKDCKKVDDRQINKLASIVKNNCVFSLVTINPSKYNELYSKLGNLNLLLAWGHARAIENILEKTNCEYALSDKFGDEKLIQNALLKKGRNIHLEQRCKAESDIAVAAASIVARAQFLNTLSELSAKYGMTLPKGANSKVIQTAKAISTKFSKEELVNTSKVHFKTYQEV